MSIFVGNLNIKITKEDLEEIFIKYGKCKIDKMPKYAFIEFVKDKDANEAIKNSNKIKLKGITLNIEWSKKSKFYNKFSKSYENSRYINYKEDYIYDYELKIEDKDKYKLIPFNN